MAYYAGNQTHTHAPSLIARLGEIRKSVAEAFTAWRVYRNTLNELNELGPRDLADLGIHPSMIRRIALEAAYGKDA